MSFVNSLLGIGTNPVTGQTVGEPFSQQQKDFIKLQFKYGLLLKQHLAAGSITQAYYDQNFWLTTQTLTPPYNGWVDEFKTAIQSEDLNWLAKTVGETVADLTTYMGDALQATASAVGRIAGTAISSTSGGLFTGFFGSLNLAGWAVVAGLGVAVYYGWKHKLIQKALGHELSKLIP